MHLTVLIDHPNPKSGCVNLLTNFISATGAWESIGTMKQARAYHAMVVCPPFMIGKASSANFSSSPGPSSHQSLLIAKVLIFINHNPTADKTCKNERKI